MEQSLVVLVFLMLVREIWGTEKSSRGGLISIQFISISSLILALLQPVVGMAQALPGGAQPGQIEKRFQKPTKPLSKPRKLRGLEETIPPAKAANIKVNLKGIRIHGSTIFSDEEFRKIYGRYLNKTVPLSAVFDIANKITALYGKKGYLISRAIVPPQSFPESGAIVVIRVIEGYIDEVIWPQQLERYRNFFAHYAEQITAMRPITAMHMERYLLLANDLPGLKFRANIRASDTNPMASTLVLELETKPYEVFAQYDNRGTDASGPHEFTLGGSLFNRLGLHETFNLSYTLAGHKDGDEDKTELRYVSAGYSQVLNPEGLLLDISGNISRGDPGTQILHDLEYETESDNISFAVQYPFIRTRPQNLNGTLALDFKNSKAIQLDQTNSKDRLRILRGELSYDRADEYNGINQVILTAHKGIDGLGSTDNDNPVASRANGKVDFFRTTLSLSRTQTLPSNHSLYLSVFGQWANDPLLSSQECGYGGAQYGRAYDSSLIIGDKCVTALAEWRYNVQIVQETLDYFQLYGFADYGKIWNIDAPAGTTEKDEASSAGIGVRFGHKWFSADLQLAKTLNEPNSTGNQDDTKGFFTLTVWY